MVGDGFCQDSVNNDQCNFDGGDCCGSCINTKYCMDCECNGKHSNDEQVNNPFVADAVCQDENNNAGCNFDGGDCCGSSINCVDTSFCSECLCHPDSPINMECKYSDLPNNRAANFIPMIGIKFAARLFGRSEYIVPLDHTLPEPSTFPTVQ